MMNSVRIFIFLAMALCGTAWCQQDGVPPSERVGVLDGQSGEGQAFQRTTPPELTSSDVSIVPPAPQNVTPAETNKEEMDVIAATNAEMEKRSGQATQPKENTEQKDAPTYSFGKMLLNTVIALCAVLAMLFFLSYGAKRMGKATNAFTGTNLGRVMGKVYLAPRVCLHFVNTGGKVLVVGVTQNAIASVAEFDAETFDAIRALAESANTTESTAHTAVPREGESFVSQLMAHLNQHRTKTGVQADEAASTASMNDAPEDQELLALRNEIQSLRRFLDESSRETKV